MLKIIKYETKKILGSKINKTVLVLFAILLLSSVVPKITNYKVYTDKGAALTGQKAVNYKINSTITEKITSKKINDDLGGFFNNITDKANDDEKQYFSDYLDETEYNRLFYNREKYLYWIMDAYSGVDGKKYFGVSDLIKTANKLPDFYEYRNEKLSNAIKNNPLLTGNKNEINYWMKNKDKTKGEYKYGYMQAFECINDSLDIASIMIIALVGILVSGVFSRESESNMVSLLLSSKYGRNKLVRAKIISTFITVLVTTAISGVIIIIPNIVYFGVGGWNLPIQAIDTNILYDWSILHFVSIRLIVMLIIALSFSSFSIMVSAATKKTYVTNIIVLLIFIMNFFITGPESKTFISLSSLLPLRFGGKLWDKMISYEFFGNVFNVYTVGIVFNIVLMIIFTIISSNVFKKQEVK